MVPVLKNFNILNVFEISVVEISKFNCMWTWFLVINKNKMMVCFSAKPIDLLAKYISSEEDDLAVEMHEPYTYLYVSQLKNVLIMKKWLSWMILLSYADQNNWDLCCWLFVWPVYLKTFPRWYCITNLPA